MMRIPQISVLKVDQVNDAVQIHLKSFQGFFLTFLGPDFIYLLYKAILLDSSGFGFCCVQDDGKMMGFVIGSINPSNLYRRLIVKYWWPFGLAAFRTFIRNPGILLHLIRFLNKPFEALPAKNCGTLMSIAVDPTNQGKGLGKQLVKSFLCEARQRGLDYVNLTTDKINNDAVNHFYLSQGFQIARILTYVDKRIMNEYLISLEKIE